MPARIIRSLSVALCLVTSACVVETTTPQDTVEEPAETPPDPAGTVTTNLIIEQHKNTLDFETGDVGAGGTAADIGLDLSMNLSSIEFAGKMAPAMVDLGPVLSLGAVTDLPTQGYVSTVAANQGNGYVVVTGDGNAYRFYIDGFLTNASTGGYAGVKVKWASLKPSVSQVEPIFITASLSGTTANLSWEPATGDVLRYKLYYQARLNTLGQGNPNDGSQPVFDVTTTSYTHTGLQSGMTYSYYVTAVYPWGEMGLPAGPWQTTVVVP